MLNAKQKTAEAAVGKWPGILLALGVDDKFLGKKHSACPWCGGTDRFRFDDKNGSGSFICSQCGAGSGMDFAMRHLGTSFKEAAASVDMVVGNVEASRRMDERSEADKLRSIKKVLNECRAVTHGDPVWRYLNRRTGIELIPTDIKFHPGLFHSDGGSYPCMVSIMRDIEGRGVTVHRTYLTSNGEKANVDPVKKFMAGKSLKGAAVRLSRVASHIGIAEGLETALAASQRFQLPVWAATNATLLEQWHVPQGVKRITIMADNDQSFTGQAAAFMLAKRLVRDGLVVDIKIPGTMNTDWADVDASQ